MNFQDASNLRIPEGYVRTIHDKDSRLLWGSVGYDVSFDGNAEQTTYSGKNKLNYLDAVSATSQTTTTFIDNGFRAVTTSNGYATKITLSVKASTTYTLSWTFKKVSGMMNPYVRVFEGTGTSTQIMSVPSANDGSYHGSFATASGVTEVNIWFYNGAPAQGTADWTFIQLEESATATAYEPYVGGTPAPNPQFPQDVNVVTGAQTVVVTGKNLLNASADTGSLNGVNYIKNGDGTYTVNGTANGTSSFVVGSIELTANTQYVVSGCPGTGSGSSYNVRIRDANYTALGFDVGNGATITPTETKTYYYQITVVSGQSVSNLVFKPMICLSTTSNPDYSSYEPYQGQSYEINLGKNLLGGYTYQYDKSGATATYNEDGTLTMTGTATATTWSTGTSFAFTRGLGVTLPAGTYTFTAIGGHGAQLISVLTDGTGEVANAVISTGDGSATFTTTDERFFYARIRVLAGATDYTCKFMLERGSISTPYAPYFTPIELAKIGSYQDYIYKSGDDWYVHKAINKVILNGSEAWSMYPGRNGTFYIAKSDIILAPSISTTPNVISDYYEPEPFRSLYNMIVDYGVANHDAQHWLAIRNKDYSDVSSFKTWLASNNTTVYYVLATPTDTQITDATLIAQLEAVYDWVRRHGYNAQVSGNLPIIINRTALPNV